MADEYASEATAALNRIAEAIDTLAGVMAWGAASEHSENHGRQKDMAAVMFHMARLGFPTVKIDGVKVCQANAEVAEDMFWEVFGVNRKDLPGKAKR